MSFVQVITAMLCLLLAVSCSGEETGSSEHPAAIGPDAGDEADRDSTDGEPAATATEQEPKSTDEEDESSDRDPLDSTGDDDSAEPGEHPLGEGADLFTWSTESFTVEPGQERYLCFASTLEEDLVIDGYASRGDSYVHHLILSRATAPEPEGFAECDVAFKSSWQQLFITGAGDTSLVFPEGAGHVLPAGTQIVAQMHLLNVQEEPVEGTVDIDMRRSTSKNPQPVNSFIFGTAAVDLPPMETTTVTGNCSPFRNVKLIAAFPHMHLMGASMVFEVAQNGGEMREVFRRDPFDFDNQIIEPLELDIPAGTPTRVTCTFNNSTDQRIGYGESTRDEMCYLVGFAVAGGGACLEKLPPNIFGR